MRRGFQCALAILALALSPPVQAESVSSEVRLIGFVRTICTVNLAAPNATVANSAVELGVMSRFCNDAAGYRVIVETPRGLSGGTIVSGSTRVPLSTDGQTILYDRNTAEMGAEAVRIEFDDGVDQQNSFTLSIRVEPKGAIF